MCGGGDGGGGGGGGGSSGKILQFILQICIHRLVILVNGPDNYKLYSLW